MAPRRAAPSLSLSVSWPQVCAFRLRRHHLLSPAGSPAEVARDLCGVHAQVMSSAELAVGVRTSGLSADAVGRAVWEDRILVKTWAMRGTLHLLTASDLALYTSAARGRRHLCFGTSRGRNVTFVRPDQWLGPWQPLDPDLAFAEIVRRYLAVHGPASRDDVARWWGGVSHAEAGRTLQALEGELVRVDVEGRGAWARAGDLDELGAAVPGWGVRLLPGFDQYVVAASAHLDRLVAGGRRELVSRTAGWISPVLVVEGRVAGVWTHRIRRDRLLVEVSPFARLPARAQPTLEREAARIGEFLGLEPALTVAEA